MIQPGHFLLSKIIRLTHVYILSVFLSMIIYEIMFQMINIIDIIILKTLGFNTNLMNESLTYQRKRASRPEKCLQPAGEENIHYCQSHVSETKIIKFTQLAWIWHFLPGVFIPWLYSPTGGTRLWPEPQTPSPSPPRCAAPPGSCWEPLRSRSSAGPSGSSAASGHHIGRHEEIS